MNRRGFLETLNVGDRLDGVVMTKLTAEIALVDLGGPDLAEPAP